MFCMLRQHIVSVICKLKPHDIVSVICKLKQYDIVSVLYAKAA